MLARVREAFRGVVLAAALCLSCTSNEDSGQVSSVENRTGFAFSRPRGFYTEPFDLTVAHSSERLVRYTLDGSDPRSSKSALEAPLPLKLRIDPASPMQRQVAPAVVVRAAPAKDASAGAVATHTYLFIERVRDLSPDGKAPGASWPAPRGAGDDAQRFDYGMDPEVYESPAYDPLLERALLALPSVSLVSDLEHFFDASTGIYTHPGERGDAWERPASVELLSPTSSFQANAGVRIRGGFSRSENNPKHGLRLLFRGVYGTPKLHYPLFDDEGAAEFDKLDLRTSQNYSWHFGGSDSHASTMNRDVFSRDLQRAMGRPYTRSRYYHLYLNGVYWGLYQSQERVSAEYGQTYFGGAEADYDVIKVDRSDQAAIEATDGTLEAWRRVWQLCEQGFEGDASYGMLEGRDAEQRPLATLPVLVDVDNLIDFMLVIFYTGNFDGPTSKYFQNQRPNNFYALKNRNDAKRGFVFFAHDNEHSLQAKAIAVTSGVSEDRVNIGANQGATNREGVPDGSYQMRVASFESFHPQWLHQRLSANAKYRARFAERARRLLEGAGLLTAAKATALFDARVAEIDLAVIAESARWGDMTVTRPRTRDVEWLTAVKDVREGFFPKRSAIVIEQLRRAGLY